MPNKLRGWTYERILKRMAQGRGQGEGAAYIPWLLIQDFPSLGRVHRIAGWKTGRVHHLFSDLESNVFLVFELSQSIIDIREQFPLFKIEETQEIARKMGVKHPADPGTKCPVILTTDFF